MHRADVLSNLEKTLPLLLLLSTKSICDRHWRDLMNITGTTFDLDQMQFSVLLSLNVRNNLGVVLILRRTWAVTSRFDSTLVVSVYHLVS